MMRTAIFARPSPHCFSTVRTATIFTVSWRSQFFKSFSKALRTYTIKMSNNHTEMSFWSMIIKPGSKHTFTVERSFHISKAVIDFSSRPHDSCGVYIHSAMTSLMVDCGDQKGIILCNLGSQDTKKIVRSEADLDVHFRIGQNITLYSEKLHPDESTNNLFKTLTIHLSGYEFVV